MGHKLMATMTDPTTIGIPWIFESIVINNEETRT